MDGVGLSENQALSILKFTNLKQTNPEQNMTYEWMIEQMKLLKLFRLIKNLLNMILS